MLKDPPLLVIQRAITRVDDGHQRAMARASTGQLADAQGGRGALASSIKPIVTHDPTLMRCAGSALTCWCGPNDNLAIFAALALAEPGDVVIASSEGFAQSALAGDLLVGMLKNKGVAGFVTDGHVRDVEGLREMGLPVFAAGITPNSCVRSGPGSVGLPVTVGGRAIATGDFVLADEDGVVTVPREQAAEVSEQLEEVLAAEKSTLEKVRAGLDVPDHIKEVLASSRTSWRG